VSRKALLLATTLFAVAACTPKADPAADIAKFRDVENQWYAAYNKSDADGVANLYADDGMILAAGAPAAVGKAAIKEYLVKDIAATKGAGLNDNNGTENGSGVSGDLGWLSAAWTVTDAKGATVDHGKYTTVFHRTNGEWKIIRDTWNSDVAPPAAAPASAVAPASTSPKA
jgi:ketosteroid isomerase-like protein